MKKKFLSIGKKNIILSVVALILVLLLATSVTYAWIDDISEVKINTDGTNKTPLTVGNSIYEEYRVSNNESDSAINLGRIIEEQTLNGKQRNVVTNGGYYYEGGNMHLSPCYGDGNTFYVQEHNPTGGGSPGFRKLTNEDLDVGVISVTLKVKSPNGKSHFWFEDIPTIEYTRSNGSTYVDSENDSLMRVSITVDGTTHVYGNSEYYVKSSNSTGIDGRLFSKYSYQDTNTDEDGNTTYENTLFTIEKGKTKTVNFKIWYEGIPSASNREFVNVDINNLNIVSSYSKTREITIVNKTTSSKKATDGTNNYSWMFDGKAKIYVAIPAARRNGSTWTAYNSSTDNYDEASYWEITNDLKDDDKATITVPAYYNDEEMFIFRCTDQGWNKTNSNASQYALASNGIDIYCWNFWSTNIPDTFSDETFTMYGATYDGTVSGLYPTAYNNVGNKGYGTWAGVDKIYFYSNNDSVNWNPAYFQSSGVYNVFIEDYSDYAENGSVYYYTMYADTVTFPQANNTTVWTGYVPKTSKKIEFRYNKNGIYGTGGNDNSYWGYSTQTDETANKGSINLATGYERGNYNKFTVTKRDSGSGSQWGLGVWSDYDGETPQTPDPVTPDAGTDSMTGYNGSCSYNLVFGGGQSQTACKKKTENNIDYYKARMRVTTTGTEIRIRDTVSGYDYALDSNENRDRTLPLSNTINMIRSASLGDVKIIAPDAASEGTYIVKFRVNGDSFLIESILKEAT